jgi:hypothetical protein
VANPDFRQALGHVYFLRGQGIVFSSGFASMSDSLRRSGWWTEDLRCVGTLWLKRHLRATTHHRPIVLVGHSCGGRSALDSARWLEQYAVPIRLLVCLDVAFPYNVPGNVECAVHLYRSRRRLYPARPLTAAPGARPRVKNIDLDDPLGPIHERRLHHLNMTTRPAIQTWIVQRIVESLQSHV